MIGEFLEYVKSNKLLEPQNKTLLAVSGGVDSVVLSHLFARSGFVFAIAHCNFGLRGKDSEEDESFVRQLAKSYGVEFFSSRLDAAGFATQEHISIQMAARELRYAWFADLLKKEGFDYLATGHHRSDTLETVLLNLTRGTGIAGLHGINPKKHNIIRPLLFADKETIKAFAQSENLKWREDVSNIATKYQRNLIRLEVVPLLKKINPEVEKSVEQMAEKVSAVERIFMEKVNEISQKAISYFNEDIYIRKDIIIGLSEPLIILFEILKPFGFNYQQVKDIVHHIQEGSAPGKVFLSAGYLLVVDREFIVISAAGTGEEEEIEIHENSKEVSAGEFRLYAQVQPALESTVKKDKNIATLDYQTLKFPLRIRSWKQGDWFRPFGMKGKKKLLSDFMIDEKIPLNLKKRVKLLISGEDIVWVIGHRIDDRYKVTDKTATVYKLIKRND